MVKRIEAGEEGRMRREGERRGRRRVLEEPAGVSEAIECGGEACGGTVRSHSIGAQGVDGHEQETGRRDRPPVTPSRHREGRDQGGEEGPLHRISRSRA